MKYFIKCICMALCCLLAVTGCAPAGSDTVSSTGSSGAASSTPSTDAVESTSSTSRTDAVSVSTEKPESSIAHVSTLNDKSSVRLYAMPEKMTYKEGETLVVTVRIVSGSTPVACDLIKYNITTDWGLNETNTYSGENGNITLSIRCDGSGSINLEAAACDASGNEVKGIEVFSGSLTVSPANPVNYQELWAEELKNEAPITLEGATYRMTFLDDFNGTELDKRKWSLCPQQTRQDVGGKWDNSCTSLDGKGNLILTAKLDENNKPISGAIRSNGKFEQAEGYFECRARLQKSPGFWGAFWLLSDSMSSPSTQSDGTAENGVELDIMESNDIYMKDINNAIHWDGYGDAHKKTAHSNHGTNCYDGEFHTFGLLWTDTAYIFYIDGKEVFRTQKGYDNYPGSCKDPCYLKATVEFGSWAGTWDATMLPDNVAFDYVKVYQKI